MRKEFEVTCEVDMDATKIIKVKVTTNLMKKACKLAEDKLRKDGHFHIKTLSCKELATSNT